jgi:hydroxymethylpyrimidine/phosphomethylpyrimidine kinase
MKPLGRVLIIAGSDSGGGAGIQADIKTVTMLGGYAATAVTAITVQNTLGVTGVVGIDPAVVEAQGMAVLDDIGSDAIKTGMLADSAIVAAAARLIDHAGVPAVIDPVMVAKGGASLLADEAVNALINLLIPRAALLAPNAPEAAVLTGMPVETLDDLRAAGRALLAMGANAVLMKGGHLEGASVTDLLMTGDAEWVFAAPRIDSRHTHGTGCTLASACATGIAQGLPLEQVVDRAIAYVREAIVRAPGLGRGHGPLNHGWPVR